LCPVTLTASIIDSKIYLTDSSINDFLNYFGTRKFGKTKGFTTEWVAKRIREEDKKTALLILKV